MFYVLYKTTESYNASKYKVCKGNFPTKAAADRWIDTAIQTYHELVIETWCRKAACCEAEDMDALDTNEIRSAFLDALGDIKGLKKNDKKS